MNQNITRRSFVARIGTAGAVLAFNPNVIAHAGTIDSPEADQDVQNFRRNGQFTFAVFGNGGSHTIDTIGPLAEQHLYWEGSEEPRCNKRQPYGSGASFTHEVVPADSMVMSSNNKGYVGRSIYVTEEASGKGGRNCEGPNHPSTISLAVRSSIIVARPVNDQPVAVFAQTINEGYKDAEMAPVVIQVFNNENNLILETQKLTSNTWLPLTDRFTKLQVPQGKTFRVEFVTNVAFTTEILEGWKRQAHKYSVGVYRGV